MTDSVFRQHCRREVAAIANLKAAGYLPLGGWSVQNKAIYVEKDGNQSEYRTYHDATEALLRNDTWRAWEQMTMLDAI